MNDSVVFVVDDDASVRGALSSFVRWVGLVVEACRPAAEFRFLDRPVAPSWLRIVEKVLTG